MSVPVAADVHIALRDGSTAHVRPVVPADAPALRTFLQNLSENSRWLRFFSLGVNLDKAFIQFAGFTAGRAASFFDFYAHDLEFVASSLGSDISSTNLLAYTATFGQGFSATLSVEDPLLRKTPIYGSASGGSTFTGFQVFTPGAGNFTPVIGTNAPVQYEAEDADPSAV